MTNSTKVTGDVVLDVTGATKRFGETMALAGVELTARRRGWLGLLGPNGAGKTTLVRTIAGRVRLDAGQIKLFGIPLDSAKATEARHRLGVVPQELALYDDLTAAENLRIFARLNGIEPSAAAERARWALDWTGLIDRADDRVGGFSGGMKRRLNLACGVLHQPDLVLLDEPTVGVDPQSRERIWQMLSQLRADGAALVLTTHQLDEAEQVCDRIAIIDHGRVIADGTLDELVAETVGRSRRVRLTLAEPVATMPLGLQRDSEDGLRLVGSVDDVAAELAELMAAIDRAGGQVTDVKIDSPSLHAVFLHLTGRELRE